ncbi:MAG: hypothetical protein ACOX5A_09220 [Aminivibrio sp.]|jgi:hypothetical protein
MLDTNIDLLSEVERIEFLSNIRRARELVDHPCLVVGERLNIPLSIRGRGLFLALLNETERALREPWS